MTLTDSERAAIRARVDVYIKAMVRLGYTPKPAGISEWIGVIHSAPDDLLALLNEVDALRAALGECNRLINETIHRDLDVYDATLDQIQNVVSQALGE